MEVVFLLSQFCLKQDACGCLANPRTAKSRLISKEQIDKRMKMSVCDCVSFNLTE